MLSFFVALSFCSINLFGMKSAYRSLEYYMQSSSFSAKPDVISSFELAKVPKSEKFCCSIRSRVVVPAIFRNPEVSSNSFFIDPTIPGYLTIVTEVSKHNFSVRSLKSSAEFLIARESPDAHSFPINSTEFSFLNNMSEISYVFSSLDCADTFSYCPPPPSSTLYYISLIAISTLLFHLVSRKFKIGLRGNPNLTFLLPSEIPAPDPFDPKPPFADVLRMKRGVETSTFERSSQCTLNNGYILKFRWKEKIESDGKTNLNISFSSQSIQITEPPTIKLHSYRRYRPVEINFHLTTGQYCTLELPIRVITSFQPYGKTISTVTSLFSDISKAISKNPFARSNLPEIMNSYCKKLHLKRAVVIGSDGEIFYNYKIPELPDIPSAEAIIQKVDKSLSEGYQNSLLPDCDRCFVRVIDNFSQFIFLAIGFDSSISTPIWSDFVIPIVTLSLVFVLQLSITKEQSSRFENFSKMLIQSKAFTFFEQSESTLEITSMKSGIWDSMPSTHEGLIKFGESLLSPSIKSLIMEIENRRRIKDRTSLQRILDTGDGHKLSALISYSTDSKGDIMTAFVEDVGRYKTSEKRFIDSFMNLKAAIDSLGVVKLSEISKALGYGNNVEIDKICMDKITPNTVARFVSKSGAATPFFIFGDYCLDLSKLVTEDTNPKELFEEPFGEFTAFLVDGSESVLPFMGFPTIWDKLCLEKSAKVSRLFSFVHPDQRASFVQAFTSVMSGEKKYTNLDVPILRIHGDYEWNKFVFGKSTDGKMICLSFDINDRSEHALQLADYIHEWRRLLISAKISVWRFTDDDCQVSIGENGTLEKEARINWYWVAKCVNPEYIEGMRKRIRNSIDLGHSFSMDIILELPQRKYVTMRGGVIKGTRELVGVMIDIDEVYKEQLELEERKKVAEAQKQRLKAALTERTAKFKEVVINVNKRLEGIDFSKLSSEQRSAVFSLRTMYRKLPQTLESLEKDGRECVK